MENRIKEQMSLFAERVSAATMRANQLRLHLSAMAYALLQALRRLALAGTRVRRRASEHHPAETVEDRSERAPECTQGVDLNDFQLSLSGAVRDAVLRLRL
jgi:Transposase DDE domain group 1